MERKDPETARMYQQRAESAAGWARSYLAQFLAGVTFRKEWATRKQTEAALYARIAREAGGVR